MLKVCVGKEDQLRRNSNTSFLINDRGGANRN